MKTIHKISTVVLLCAGTMFSIGCEKENVIMPEQVPSDISSFVQLHFSDHEILQVIKDTDGFVLTYDVILSDGISLEFNRKKEIIDIDSDSQLPDSVIPEPILTYIHEHYSSNVITDWELEDRHQQIGLDNGLDLEFTKKGEFIRIDH